MFNRYGIQVKKRIVELGISQKELAEIVGVEETYLSKIINGKKKGWKYRADIDRVLENEPSRWFERESDI